MEEYFRTLYSTDPLFKALVHSKLRELDESSEEFIFEGSLRIEDEIEILREYAITLYKEHKSLKNLFMENLKVTGKAIGLPDQERPSEKP